MNLTNMLGIVHYFETRFVNETANTDGFSSFSMSYGQVATERSVDGSVDTNNLFDGTNVYLAFTDSSASGGPVTLQNGNSFEIITTILPFEGLPSATGNTGPFWLYRNTVPEPTSIVLLAIGTLAVLSKRNRRR